MSDKIQQEIEQLNQQTFQLYQNGEYNEGMEVSNRVYKLACQYLDKNNYLFAKIIENRALLYEAIAQYDEAEKLYNLVIEIRRQTLGESHQEFASSLSNLAGFYYFTGNYTEAEKLYQKTLEIYQNTIGKNHPDFANSINNLAVLYEEMGKYTLAESLYYQALDIFRKELGENHPNFAHNINNLARLYYFMGDYFKTESFLNQALKIRGNVLGESHPEFAVSLNNLAMLYTEIGNYVKAEPLYIQALEIQCNKLGEEHPDIAITKNNLAELYREMGNYAKAEPLLQQSVEIFQTTLEENNPYFANILNNLAIVYYLIGNYTKAEQILENVLEIRRNILGENHPEFAVTLSNLGMLYDDIDNYDKAEFYYKQALEIWEKALDKNHIRLATGSNNLAMLYNKKGKYFETEPLYQKAINICQIALGENHPDYAKVLNNIASLYQDTGKYKDAEIILNRVINIHQKIALIDHPDYATYLQELAKIYVAMGQEYRGFLVSKDSAKIDDKIIGDVFSISSESQRMDYLKTIEENLATFISLVLQYFSESINAVRAAFELILRRKGISTEASAMQRYAVWSGKYPELKNKLEELTILQMLIAKKTLAGPTTIDELQEHKRLLEEWNIQKEKLEVELARQIPEIKLLHKLQNIDLYELAETLPVGGVLVEFVRINVYNFKAIPAQGERRWKPDRYLAWILPTKKPNDVHLIDLGEADIINKMIAKFRTSITGDTKGREFETVPMEFMPSANKSNGIALRKTVFDPLLQYIENYQQLFLAPDGDLSRLPFEVLPTDDGNYLIDYYHICYLSTGRDLLRFQNVSKKQPNQPVVAADPDFDLESEQKVAITEILGRNGKSSRELARNLLNFQRLPGTRKEGKQVATMLGVIPWLESSVLESRLKQCYSPRILHIATHGFFLEDQTRDFRESSAQKIVDKEMIRLSGSKLENPLLRSGLALAGANVWLKKGSLPIEAEDGILTAEDVSGLNLLDTELVVLSACETGLGEIRTGEGVFGLRRAFMLAGTKTLLISLWKVPDEQTQELMTDFYHRILAGQPRADALREAQLAMKVRYPNPLYWGGFICQGNPFPLEWNNENLVTAS